MPSGLHPNHSFLLNFAFSHGGRILDFGCGNGEMVKAGCDTGLDIYGADNFFCMPEFGTASNVRTALGDRLIEIGVGGQISCPDQYFDLVVTNQVFEHVADMGSVLAEMRRVLKPNGTMVHIFPSREVWREGHCHVPFAHRVKHTRRFLRMGYALGLGFERHYFQTVAEWVECWDAFLHEKCFYRTLNQIHSSLATHGFVGHHIEADYAMWRSRLSKPWLGRFIKATPELAAFAIRRLAGIVIVCRPDLREAVP